VDSLVLSGVVGLKLLTRHFREGIQWIGAARSPPYGEVACILLRRRVRGVVGRVLCAALPFSPDFLITSPNPPPPPVKPMILLH